MLEFQKRSSCNKSGEKLRVSSQYDLASVAQYIWRVRRRAIEPTPKETDMREPAILESSLKVEWLSEMARSRRVRDFVDFLWRNLKFHGNCIDDEAKPVAYLHRFQMRFVAIA